MPEIDGKAKTIRELLSEAKYSVDYYQREYKWKTKQIQELIQDLSNKFLDAYKDSHERGEVEKYGHYFLGSIIISQKDYKCFIIDGQQRLTTLTLLLIYLRNLQKGRKDQVSIDELIYSEKHARKTFNINVEERTVCMEALFEGKDCDDKGQPEAVQNILARYQDIKENFPEELVGKALPYFIDWLIYNVHLVKISAYSDDDAYTIFETMNDRGLSLSPTDMLKGFLLANITDAEKKTSANIEWKKIIQCLNEYDKDTDSDCLKTWLRSQYAETTRERKKGAKPEDFDRIGTEFHRWVRDNKEKVGLDGDSTYLDFIGRHFKYYATQYLRVLMASEQLTPGLESIYSNAQLGFTLQYHLLLAPLAYDDKEQIANLKMRLVSKYLDILLTRRLWNFRSINYSTMQYAMFLIMRNIRRKAPKELALILYKALQEEKETFSSNDRLCVHGQNRGFIHTILARITAHIEENSGMSSHYVEYMTAKGSSRYEVEHIWADKPERHTDEFPHPNDFDEYRNHIGGLLLLPRSFNGSYGDLPYDKKLPHYLSQNILAQSLNPQCYDRNPGFLRFIKESGLPFRPHPEFKKANLDERQELYRKVAEQIWDPELLLKEIRE